ncbi:interferon-induced protein 44-like [Saccostrea cucullata]|uniref:interferon-induced protein 44-like n=1 Tax=Saccostrea cuccullata TaxID=36930 RepID=UPI002ED35F9A
MDTQLNEEDKTTLLQWIGVEAPLSLLYKMSRDGCNPWTFHTKCDCKGPTITVMYNGNNTVYGGYTSQNWNSSSNGYFAWDQRAFLFKLRYNGKSVAKKYPIKADKCGYAIYCRNNYGPSFGESHDLPYFEKDISASNGVYQLNRCNYGNDSTTYIMGGDEEEAIYNNEASVRDLEYCQELKEYVQNFCPYEKTSVDKAKILLLGEVGSGKSSFFNTVNSIFAGFVTFQAISGSAQKSLTNTFRTYHIRDGKAGKMLNFKLCDTKGLEKEGGIDPHDFLYILDGNMPDKHMLNPDLPLSPETQGFVKSPSAKDKIHLVAIVIDATIVDVMTEESIETIKSFQKKLYQRGMISL